MKEYIVSVDDDLEDYDEMFVGNIRNGDVLTRCKDCKYYCTPKPKNWAKRDAKGNFIGYEMIQEPSYCELYTDEYVWQSEPDYYCSDAKRKDLND